MFKIVSSCFENPACRPDVSDLQGQTKQHSNVAGNAKKIYPMFISYDHTGQTFWAIWLKNIEQVHGNVTLARFLNVYQFVWYPTCSELSRMKVAMENFTDSTQRYCKLWRYFPYMQICGSAFTHSGTANTFSSSDAVFWRLRGVTVFLSLTLEQNKSCHLLVVACKEALDPMASSKSLRILNVPSPSLSCAETWKCSICLLKCPILQSEYERLV